VCPSLGEVMKAGEELNVMKGRPTKLNAAVEYV
jgi:hypothetical protein